MASAHYCPQICLCVSSGDAQLFISDAETKVIACYMALVDAERDGANVTELAGVLNKAGWLLSKAKLAHINDNYEDAIKYAEECLLMLEGFMNKAETLRREAGESRRSDFMLNYVGSGVGALCIAIGGYAIWFYLTRRKRES